MRFQIRSRNLLKHYFSFFERVLLPEKLGHKQDIFDGYIKEYKRLLDPLSITNEWKHTDKEKQCYATKVLFYPESFE